ncbi:glycosyltransferase family 2 protein [Candidatus Saccharibacteria bacterium]|nr:glycosyltransferase family 2 protein [Candidatus Saccharibacteria bacterium]
MRKLKKKEPWFKPHTKSDWADNEIPQGKRTLKYRIFEILPGALSYSMIIVLVVLSILWPAAGSIYLLFIITITLVKAVGVAFRTVQGYNTVKKAEKVNWRQRVVDLETPHESYERHYSAEVKRLKLLDIAHVKHNKKQAEELEKYAFDIDIHIANLKKMAATEEKDKYPDPTKIYHAILVMAYNEGEEILGPSIEAVKKSSFPGERIILVLGYEERGGAEIEEVAKKLQKKYSNDFYDFLIVKHPDGLPGEIKGKGPNLCYAGEALLKYVKKEKIPVENVIVTSLDSDNRMSEGYLDYVAYEFVTRPNRQKLSYQPVSLFMNNIWDATAPCRVIAISNSFFNIISTMRPHTLRNFASHSQPLQALSEMDFWSKRTIVEDGHQYWRSLFHFRGDYDVVPVHVAIYQDAVMEETFLKTLKAQFIQLRRWDYGASDVAFVGVRLFSKDRKKRGKMGFVGLFAKFWRLLDGHVMLAAMSPMVAFGGWVPRLFNYDSRDLLTYNLPDTVSIVQMFAAIGLLATIIVSLRMIPPRPPESKKIPKLVMVLQWVLMPIVAIVYQSFAAFYSQTRLMLGLYMEKFDVTKKVVRKKEK